MTFATLRPSAPTVIDKPVSPLSGRAVVLVQDPRELQAHLAAWEELAAAAIEPNAFYEPMLLLSAIQSLGAGCDLEFVLVYSRPDRTPESSPVLCGFFPLQRHRRLNGIPFRYVSSWQYDFCYLCTPLVRAESAAETLSAFLDYLVDGQSGSPLLKLEHVGGDGPFHKVLAEVLQRRNAANWNSKRFTRALFRLESSWEDYQRTILSSNLRKKLRRRKKHLAALGNLEHVSLTTDGDVETWLEEFLQLEAAGWKGRNNSAMASTPASRTFLVNAAREAFRRRRLVMSALRLDGKPLAIHCDFLSGSGCFGFKSAFDEQFAAHSPGILLEWLLLADLHRQRQISWIDSCADGRHSVFNRIWNARRAIESFWISTGHWSGDLAVFLLPLLKRVKQTLLTSKRKS